MNTSCLSKRRGFTLVEMLVVVAIIGILAAILLPAVYAALKAGKINRIAQEVNQLHSSVEGYKQKYTDYPSDFSDAADLTRHIHKAFPQFRGTFVNASMIRPDGTPARKADGTLADISTLDPAEALVFWLGMLRNDPRSPFNWPKDASGNAVYDPAQRVSLFPFEEGRFTDVDGDGWYEYAPRDGKGVPYVYFNSRTYNTGYANYPASLPPCRYVFDLGSATLARDAVYPYQTQRSHAVAGVSAATIFFLPNNEWVNPTSFQIVCAGLDGRFGADPYDAKSQNTTYTNPALNSTSQHKQFPSVSTTGNSMQALNWSQGDMDNISNFSDGKVFEDRLE